MPLLEKRDYFRPFEYDWAFRAYDLQQKMHWLPSEIPLHEDIRDWKTKLSEGERSLLTQLFRFFTQADTDIAAGYIDKYLPIFKPPEIRMMLSTFASFECFDDQSEILTSEGWKRFDSLDENELVAQYCLETKEISFAKPLKVIRQRYKGKMHHYSSKGTDLMVTPNHDLILIHPESRKVSKNKSENGKWGRNYLYPRAGLFSLDSEFSFLDALIVAIQADGCLRGLCPSAEGRNWKTVDFNLTKVRKIERLEQILNNLKIPYTKRKKTVKDNENRQVITFCVPDNLDINSIKNFDYFKLCEMGQSRAEGFINELVNWDGTMSSDVNIAFYSTNKQAIDKVQAIASISGHGASISVNRTKDYEYTLKTGQRIKANKDCFVVNITRLVKRTYPHRKEVDYDSYVYCVSVPKQNVLIRRNGKIAITGNSIHQQAYSLLLDTIGMSEGEYKRFREFQEMRDKHDFLETIVPKTNRDIALTLAVYSAFGEGLQLFSTFAVLLNFSRFNKMKGMGQIVTFSIKDEQVHIESMIKLFHEFLNENPEIWTPDLKREIIDKGRQMVDLEFSFIDLVFQDTELEGLRKEDIKTYIKYIADRRFIQLGLDTQYGQKNNPLGWLDWIINGAEFVNFFENRVSEYSKGSLTGSWDEAYS